MYSLARVLAAVMLIASAVSAEKLGDHWSVNFNERFRLVTWDNAISLDQTAAASRTFTRHRTQLGTVWMPDKTVAIGLQLANEFRYYAVPSTVDFHMDEVFVDLAYVKLTRPRNLPVTVTVGRQNIILGEGFIVIDGHPLDGSRSIYFNAARLDLHFSPARQLTAFASYIEETDNWLPVIHTQRQALVEQPETGLGLYYTVRNQSFESDTYVVFKRRGANDAFPHDASTVCIGARLKVPLSLPSQLYAVVEGAGQLGEQAGGDRRAIGAHGYVEHRPARRQAHWYLPSLMRAGAIYLSGDNPGTKNREGWDPMFARWPKWSESYIYTQVKEDAVAWWTNLWSLNAAIQFALSPSSDLRFDYHHLGAPQRSSDDTDFPGGRGSTRGDLFIGKLTYRFDQRWSGHLLWEGFVPGDYYFEGADSYAWIRAELMFQY